MQRLSDPAFLRGAGMYGHDLLNGADPSKIAWSFVLYERGTDRNHVRVHADSLNRPFDINSGSKLQLGSTAKLRTLITYLEIIAELHASFPVCRRANCALRLRGRRVERLGRPLSGAGQDRGLRPMLDAAMQRPYSAAPETFFTGGGNQSFGNFESWEDSAEPTVSRPSSIRSTWPLSGYCAMS